MPISYKVINRRRDYSYRINLIRAFPSDLIMILLTYNNNRTGLQL